MTGNAIPSMLADLWGDLSQPDLLWQLAALGVCVLVAWGLSRIVRVRTSQDQPAAIRMGAGGFNRIVFPLVVVVLLLAARLVLARWTHVNLLSVAIPVFAS